MVYFYCRYIDGIKPGKYGIAKPLYFPFLPSYWLGRPRNVAKNKVRIRYV